MNTLIRLEYNSLLVCKSLIVVIGWNFLHANNVFLNGDIVKKVCDMKSLEDMLYTRLYIREFILYLNSKKRSITYLEGILGCKQVHEKVNF